MKNFLKDALSENGSASSKRIAFYVLLFAFLAECAANIIWKRILDPTLRDQLYYAMLTTLGAIVGVTAVSAYKDIKIAQSNSTPPAPTDAVKP